MDITADKELRGRFHPLLFRVATAMQSGDEMEKGEWEKIKREENSRRPAAKVEGFPVDPATRSEQEKQEEEEKRNDHTGVFHCLCGPAPSENEDDELGMMAKKKIDGHLLLLHEKRYQEPYHHARGTQSGEEKRISYLYIVKREDVAIKLCGKKLALPYPAGEDGHYSLFHRLSPQRKCCQSSKFQYA